MMRYLSRAPRGTFLALAGYTALALLLTWPLALNLGRRFAGDNPVDAWGHYWNIWWLKVALLRGQNPYVTDMWFAPEGTPLYLHTLALFNSALGLLPQALAGTLVAYNVVVLVNIVLAGQATFLLARHLTGHAGAAFVAGLAFAASPYLIGHLNVGHLNVAALAPLPLFLLALLHAAEGSRRHIPLAAAWLLATALGEWHTTLFAIIAGALLIGWQALLAARREISLWAPLRAAGAVLLGGLLLLPLALRTAQAVARVGPAAELGDRWAERHSANLLAFVSPQDLHPLWDKALQGWRQEHLTEVLTEGRVSLGLAVLALSLLGVWALRWRAVPWLALAAVGIGLALGPVLHVGTSEYDLPLPYDLFDALPYADVSRTPARFSTLAVLALAVLVAYGVRWLAGCWRRPAGSALSIGLAGLLVVGEFLTVPYGLTVPPDTTVARAIGQEIAAHDPQATVLTVPYRRAEQERLYHQVHHERPIYGGFIPRDIEHPFRMQTPGFAELGSGRPFRDIFEPAVDPLAVFRYFHVRYIMVYRGEIKDDEPGRRLLATLRGLVRQEAPAFVSPDGTIEAWRVPLAAPPPAFLRAGGGWEAVETWPTLGRTRWMTEQAALYLERPTPGAATIELTAVSFARPRRLEVRAGEQVVGVFTIPTEPTEIAVEVPTGQATIPISLRSLDGADSPSELGVSNDERQLSIAMAHVQVIADAPATGAFPRIAASPAPVPAMP